VRSLLSLIILSALLVSVPQSDGLELRSGPEEPCNCYGRKHEQILEKQLEQAEKQGKNSIATANALVKLANLYWMRVDYDSAVPLLERSMAIFEKGKDEDEKAQARLRLSRIYLAKKRFPEADAQLRLLFASPPKSIKLRAQMFEQQANIMLAKDDLQGAETSLIYAVNSMKNRKPQDDLDYVRLLEKLATFYQEQKAYDKAEDWWKQAIAIRKKLHRAGHMNTTWDQEMLAQVYTERKEFSRAEALLKEVIRDKEKLFGTKDPMLLSSLSAYSSVLYRMNRPAEADKLRARAVTITQILARKTPHAPVQPPVVKKKSGKRKGTK
jgi:tetratricopeptide (TPR) repeat protein